MLPIESRAPDFTLFATPDQKFSLSEIQGKE
jgi:peroxiredoxin